MATDNIEAADAPDSYEFDCESIPLPPGTKTPARLPRGDEPDPITARAWWLIGALTVVALLVGILIGRVLL